jgi:hypothetical protein
VALVAAVLKGIGRLVVKISPLARETQQVARAGSLVCFNRAVVPGSYDLDHEIACSVLVVTERFSDGTGGHRDSFTERYAAFLRIDFIMTHKTRVNTSILFDVSLSSFRLAPTSAFEDLWPRA